MSYPYEQYNASSEHSRNEFMLSQSLMLGSAMGNTNRGGNNEVEKIFSYMKNVMSNPMLMDQMQKFLAMKQAQKNSSYIFKQNDSLSVPKMESQIRQPSDSHIIQTPFQQKPQPLRVNNRQNVRKVKSPEMVEAYPNTKNSANGLMAYINNQADQQIHSKQSFMVNEAAQKIQRTVKPQQKQISAQQNPMTNPQKQAISFDDLPIKSAYIAENKFNNFDSRSAYPPNQSEFYGNNLPKNIAKKTSITNVKTNTNRGPAKIIDLQERPIKGTQKDFKQLLKQQFKQSPFDENPLPAFSKNSSKPWEEYDNQMPQNQHEQQENQLQNKPKRQFLKRGSRQYLSSAKDRKSITRKPKQGDEIKGKDSQQNLNSSRMGGDKIERDKTPTKRDVSQNRVLSKRNTNINDKSISKLKTQNNLNNSAYCDQNQQDQMKESITPQNQRVVPKTKSPVLPPKNNNQQKNIAQSIAQKTTNSGSGKKKNVFDDSSSSEDNQMSNNDNTHNQGSKTRQNNFINQTKGNQYDEKKFNSYQSQKEFNMFQREKKEEVIEGVYLTKSQLNSILQRYAPKLQLPPKNQSNNQEKSNQLRKKYTDLCNLVQKQKLQHEQQMEKQREQFQNYKQQEIQKLKNQRRVMERQLKSSMPSQSQNLQKDKEEVENLKKELEKERQEHKKKEKNNKILIEKYKKENQELKLRIQKLEQDFQKQSQSQTQNNFLSGNPERQPSHHSNNTRVTTSANDKSRSKAQEKDVSPGKVKMNKSNKFFEQKQEENEEKNYKKTVPLYKQGQQEKKLHSAATNESQKKLDYNQQKKINEDNNSDEDNLPTFKVDNKKNENSAKAIKPQKKYQYIQNSAEEPKIKKQAQTLQGKTRSNDQRKLSSKNVFADESDQQNDVDDNDHQSDNESGDQVHQSGFFKSNTRYEKLQDLMNASFSIKDVTPQIIENLFRYQNNSEYRRYLQRVNNQKRIIVNSSKNGVDKKITNIYNDKSKEILFENGVKKQIFQDGYTIIYFKNGDIKQKLEDGTTLYYFNDKKVDQITLVNGINIYRFDNNQVEIHYDGNKYIQIRHPDGTIKMLGSPIH